ncbi:MAG: hypothetical protein KR126chlam6_01476 [Candidatus Anoxychlamydiales bacterium]|nr:hypothetical protein [Candidatus Anoxychlamydiales bacterium]
MKNSFFLILLLFTSCGYHLGRSENTEKLCVCVPYVENEFAPHFTSEIIKQITYSPTLVYTYSDAPYSLRVKIIEDSVSQIGYRYDRNNQNVRQKDLRATEGRQKITAQVEIIETDTNISRFGPVNVTASEDFDYVDQDSLSDLSFIDPNGVRTTVLSFSLGQLESIESAKDAASKPLYEKLAKKIVDAISAYW